MEPLSDNLNDFPQLKAVGKNNPFITPEGYFEQLPSAVVDRVHSNHPVRINWIPRVVLVSCILAGAVILINWYAAEKETPATPTAFEITSEHITETGYLMDMDEHLLVEAMSSESIENEYGTENIEEFQEFLIDNKTDINLIINEL